MWCFRNTEGEIMRSQKLILCAFLLPTQGLGAPRERLRPVTQAVRALGIATWELAAVSRPLLGDQRESVSVEMS